MEHNSLGPRLYKTLVDLELCKRTPGPQTLFVVLILWFINNLYKQMWSIFNVWNVFCKNVLFSVTDKTERNFFKYLLHEILCTVDRRHCVSTPVGRGERKIIFSFRGILPAIVVPEQERFNLSFTSKDKGKAIPLQVWTGPEGSRRLRLPDFKTIGAWNLYKYLVQSCWWLLQLTATQIGLILSYKIITEMKLKGI
jgi:hypothetical protein